MESDYWGGAVAKHPLNHQNLRVGGYTEEVLKWFNYPQLSKLHFH